MSELFATDFCLSGRCVCRNFTEATIIARELSCEKNHQFEKRRAEELLREAQRLLMELDEHRIKQ